MITEEEIRRMSLPIMEFIVKLYLSDGKGYAEGKSGGAHAKEAYRLGYIIPSGKTGRRIRWELVEGKFNHENILLMRRLTGFPKV